MRKNYLVAALMICSAALGDEPRDCGPVPPGGTFDGNCTLTAVPPREMKGFNLFSWQEGTQWYFSIVPGKNSYPEKSEILRVKVKGTSEIKRSLSKLASGSFVSWNSSFIDGELALKMPPKKVIQEIQKTAQQKNIRLTL